MTEENQSFIFIADAGHSDRIAGLCKDAEKVIISFSIDGKLALERRGVRCLFPDDLISLPDLNKMGLDNLHPVKGICAAIDGKLKEKVPFLRENGIDLFRNGFFNIKVFFDSLCSSFLILETLFQKTGHREIVLFSSGCELGKIAEGKCPLVPSLIEHVFLKGHPEIRIVTASNDGARRDGLSDYISYFNQLGLLLRAGFRENGETASRSKGIVLDNRYDVKTLIDNALGGIDFFKISVFRRMMMMKSVHTQRLSVKMLSRKENLSEIIEEGFREIRDELAANEIFHGNSDLGLFAVLCLEQYAIKSLAGILQHGKDIKEMFSEMAPVLLITSACRMDLRDAFFLGIAKSVDIPVVTYQEGGGAGYLDWPLFNLDTELSDFFLVYGNGVADSSYIEKKKAAVIPVGSIYLDHVKRNIISAKESSNPKGIYVILDNIKKDTWQHYPYNGGNFSQAYRHQLNVIETLKKFEKADFILKTVEGREELYFAFANANHIRIETKPLSSVLAEASAFILDYPSTVLQECLLTDKPIALFFNKTAVRFDDHAFDLLKRRVRVAFEYDEIHGILEELLEDVEKGNPMTKNKDFLMKYCLMENARENVHLFLSNFLHKEAPAKSF